MKFNEYIIKNQSEMIESSLVNMGNTYRLNEKIKLAQNGEKVTLAFQSCTGGNITQGK